MVISVFYILGASFLWTLIPVCTRFVMRSGDIGPYTLTFFRFLFGVLVLIVIQKLRRRKIGVFWCKSPLIIISGLALGLDFILLNSGLKYTTAIMGGLLINTCVPMMIFLGWIILKERFGLKRFLSLIVTLVGLYIAVTDGADFIDILKTSKWTGNLLVAGSGIVWAIYSVLHKMVIKNKVDTLEILIPILTVGMLMALVFSIAKEKLCFSLDPIGWTNIVILGVGCTGIGYFLLGKGLKGINLAVAGIVTSITPVMSLIMAHILLKETLNKYTIGGLIFIVVGILLSVNPLPQQILHKKRGNDT